MKIELEVREMVHLLWSHSDAIPMPVSQHVAQALQQKIGSGQLRMECNIFIRNYYGTITENQVDSEGEKLYNKIVGLSPTSQSMSKYADLAKG